MTEHNKLRNWWNAKQEEDKDETIKPLHREVFLGLEYPDELI